MAPVRPQIHPPTRNSVGYEPRSPSPQKKVPTKTGMTPSRSPIRRSPMKSVRKKTALSIAQKQAIMENIQLEVTERARRLRSQYNLQAQNLKMTIELRVNRIPMAYRKLTMDALIRRAEGKKCGNDKPPPVPEKDNPPQKPNTHATTTVTASAHKPVSRANLAKLLQARPMAPPPARHGTKRLSSDMNGGDKENHGSTALESHNKRLRGSPIREMSSPKQAGQVLSPTSSNTRVLPPQRTRSPTKPGGAFASRPASPLKPATTPATALAGGRGRPILVSTTASSVARSRALASTTNAAAAARQAMPPPSSISRKVTTSSSTSSSSAAAAAGANSTMTSTTSSSTSTSTSTTATRGRGRPPISGTTRPTTTVAARTTAAAGRPRRKVSGSSSTATGTTTTTTAAKRKAAGTTASVGRPAGAAPKKTVMSTIRKGVSAATAKKVAGTTATSTTSAAAAKRTAATRAKTAVPAPTRSLRKRN